MIDKMPLETDEFGKAGLNECWQSTYSLYVNKCSTMNTVTLLTNSCLHFRSPDTSGTTCRQLKVTNST